MTRTYIFGHTSPVKQERSILNFSTVVHCFGSHATQYRR
jgi:hypothetical protein